MPKGFRKDGTKLGFQKGQKQTDEHRRKIAEALRGKKRKPFSDEWRKKMSEAHVGNKSRSGMKNSEEMNRKISEAGKGHRLSMEVRLRLSEMRKGDGNPSWRGGVTPLNKKLRKAIENRIWREGVFDRDNWTCQICGIRGGRLHAHHIKPFSKFPELRLDVDNGITLCCECHKDIHRKKNAAQLMRKILVILLFTVSLNAWADKWYVATTGSDTHGKGTLADPWLTVKHAADTITGAAFVGDTIVVGAGTFTENSQIALGVGVSLRGAGATTIITSGAALNPIVYLASASENTAGNQSISHLKFDGDNTAVMAIHARARSSVVVHDCEFVDFTDNAVRFTGLVSGSGEPTNYAINNKIYNCSLTNCGGETYSAPNYFASAAIGFSGQANAEAYDNYVDNSLGNYAYGINTNGIGYNRGLKIYDNTILISPKHVATNQWQFAIELWNNTGGIQIYDNNVTGGIDFGGVGSNDTGGYGFAIKVYGNVVALPGLQAWDHTGVIIESDISGGVYVYGNIIKNYNYGLTMNALSGPADTMEDIYVYSNIFIETTKTSDYSGRAIASGSNGVSFSKIYLYNNTCYTYSYKASAGFHFATSGAVFNNINIRNNIFNNAYNAIRFENNTIAGLHIDNNCFYGQTNAVSFVSVTASDTTRSGNLYSTNPLFKSSSDFHLQSTSPCRDAGIDVSAITGGTDFHGASLYGAAYDIGAFEYQGTGRVLLIIDDKIATINYKIPLIEH
jgi:hypothetical protein